MHDKLAQYGRERTSLLGVQECEGGWDTVKNLAQSRPNSQGNELEYLRAFAGTAQLCGQYDPDMFDLLADGVIFIWSYRHLQWARLRQKRTGRIVFFVNVHWDHTGQHPIKVQEAENTRRAIVDNVEPGDVVIMTGDFNVFSDHLKAEMNKNLLTLGMFPDGKGDVFGEIDYIWSSHTPKLASQCQAESDESLGSDHNPIKCIFSVSGTTYDDTGTAALPGSYPWRV